VAFHFPPVRRILLGPSYPLRARQFAGQYTESVARTGIRSLQRRLKETPRPWHPVFYGLFRAPSSIEKMFLYAFVLRLRPLLRGVFRPVTDPCPRRALPFQLVMTSRQGSGFTNKRDFFQKTPASPCGQLLANPRLKADGCI